MFGNINLKLLPSMAVVSYEFGEFTLFPAARELSSKGSVVELPPKSLDCLIYLIEHRGRAVGRDELISAVWGRADISDALLQQTLWRARRAVGDNGNEQSVVRTVRGFGYRWTADVSLKHDNNGSSNWADLTSSPSELVPTAPAVPELPVEPVDVPVSTAAPSDFGRRKRVQLRTRLIVCGVFALLVLVSGFVWRAHRSINAPDVHDSLIVVLPVSGVESESESSWIRFGVMDYIANRLRKVGNLKVMPSQRVVSLIEAKSLSVPLDEDAIRTLTQATGATQIISPRAFRHGAEWTVTLEIVNAQGSHQFKGVAAAPLDAARISTAEVLAGLGITSVTEPGSVASISELLGRIDAAVLVGDYAQANQLVDSAPGDLQNDPQLRLRKARIAQNSGALDRAEGIYAALIEGNSSLPPDVRAVAQIGEGGIEMSRMNAEAAEQLYTKAIAVLSEHGSPDLLGDVYLKRGAANEMLSRGETAISDLALARVEFNRTGDQVGIASVDTNLGLIEGDRGHYLDALAAFDRAGEVFARFGVRDRLAISLINKADAQFSMLDYTQMAQTSERALQLAVSLNNPILINAAVVAKVQALLAMGQLREARTVLDHFDSAEPTSSTTEPAFVVLRAMLASEELDWNSVAESATKILDRVQQRPEPTSQVEVSTVGPLFIEAALRAHRLPLAEAIYARLNATLASPNDLQRSISLEHGLAMLFAAKGNPTAKDHFVTALMLADQRGNSQSMVDVCIAYARYMSEGGDLTDALMVIGRLLPYMGRDYDSARAIADLYRALNKPTLALDAQSKAATLAGDRPVESAP